MGTASHTKKGSRNKRICLLERRMRFGDAFLARTNRRFTLAGGELVPIFYLNESTEAKEHNEKLWI